MKSTALFLAVLLGACGSAMAQTPIAGSTHRGDLIEVLVNGRQVDFRDSEPVVEDGRVLVPLRAVLTRLPGFALVWDPADMTVAASYGNRNVRLRLGSRNATVNGRQVVLDVPAKTIDGRTMVPLRFLSEALGAVVTWNDADMRVTIAMPEEDMATPGGIGTRTQTAGLPRAVSAATTRVGSTRPIVSANPRRFFRIGQNGASRRNVQLSVGSRQTMTDAELLAALEEQLDLEYTQWAHDRAAWMADYNRYQIWAELQLTFNSMMVYNGSSALNGMPESGIIPLNPGAWMQWNAVLDAHYLRDLAHQERFNADYAAYVEVFRRVHPTGTPVPKPSPP